MTSRAPVRGAAALAALLVCAGTAAPAAALATAQPARPLAAALADGTIRGAIDRVEAGASETAHLLARIGAIVSPSGQEHARAEEVAREMRAAGLSKVIVDGAPNAIGVIPGRSGRALVFVSTLDDLATVAAHQKQAGGPPRVEGTRVVGPGTNTSATTAAMLAAARALVESGFRPEHDLVFAAVAQEETGLTGMRALYETWRSRAVGFVDILGDGSSISYGAIAIHWWKVVAAGPSGHSLGGGLPNVNQAIARAVDRISSIREPAQHQDSRTVLNIAVLASGSVFNHKPDTGWFSLDIRSLDARVIDAIERQVGDILAGVSRETGIALRMEPFQLTPGGQIPRARESVLVTTAEAISRHLGLEPRLGNAGSSNMNVAIGGGTPAIGIGGSRGGLRAEPGEWADIPAMTRAAKHVVLLAGTVGAAR